jgi:hypothetical protein
MARNKTSEGMPNRFESLIVKMLRMMRLEKTMKITPMEVGIVLIFRGCSTRPDAVYSTDDRITLATRWVKERLPRQIERLEEDRR